MDRRVYRCAIEGDTGTLLELVREDELVLARVLMSCDDTPLHVATMMGHVGFAKLVLRLMPRYAEVLDQKRRSPLHLASAINCTEIAREILRVDAGLCLLRDKDGRNPLHIAAVKGFIQVTEEILAANPGCLQEVTTGGETVLHLTVRKNRVELLRYLLGREDIGSLLDKKDGRGRTVLDLALIGNNSEIKYALISSRYVLDSVSSNGTAPYMDMESRSHSSSCDEVISNQTPCPSLRNRLQLSVATRESRNCLKKNDTDGLAEEQDDAIMVVISLLTVMATCQNALKLLGLIWQDDAVGSADSSTAPAPMLGLYSQLFLVANALGFFASLVNIFLLLIPLPMMHRRMQRSVMFTMRISVSSAAASSIFRLLIGLATEFPSPPFHYSPLALNSLVYVGLLERPRLFHMVMFSRKLLGWMSKKLSRRGAV